VSAARLPLVIAHRGASAEEPENSLAAFRAAARLGADAVELDVHASADGELFVHHDETLDGTHHLPHLNARRIAEHRLENGEPVPTLAQALAAAGRLRVFVEVKSLGPQFDDAFLATLDGGPNRDGYAVHSFDHRIIRRLKGRRASLPCGALSTSYLMRPTCVLEDAQATVLWQEYRLIDRALVDAVHAAGARVIAWTVDDSEHMRYLLDSGVDALCTNVPDVGRRVVDARVA
jgi:glycerophosphoryl diester phosphodiesterase